MIPGRALKNYIDVDVYVGQCYVSRNMEAHHLAERFPLLSEDSPEFQLLWNSIAEYGLENPIVLLDGKILDGRNRFRVCQLTNTEPKYIDFNDIQTTTTNPEEWVWIQNFVLRHLSESERALIVARKREYISDLRQQVTKSTERLRVEDETAKKAGCSRTTIKSALALADREVIPGCVLSEVSKKAANGIPIEGAAILARQTPEIQQSVMATNPKTLQEIKRAVAECKRQVQRDNALQEAAEAPQSAHDIRLGAWQDVLADVTCHTLIVDPPYSFRTHTDGTTRDDGSDAAGLTPSFECWGEKEVNEFVQSWSPRVSGWMVALCDDELITIWRRAYESAGRKAFQAIPCVINGMTPRLSGDGPASEAVYAMVARTQGLKLGSLPGKYVGNREQGAGGGRGKPTWLMDELVKDYSLEGNIVCDPMAGWGTTLISALRLNRRIIGGEVDTKAYAEALTRIGKRNETLDR